MISKQHIFRRRVSLLLGVVVIWVVVSVIAPIVNTCIPGMDRLISVTEMHHIDPGAFWYTDVGVSDEAMVFLSGSTESVFSK